VSAEARSQHMHASRPPDYSCSECHYALNVAASESLDLSEVNRDVVEEAVQEWPTGRVATDGTVGRGVMKADSLSILQECEHQSSCQNRVRIYPQ
jgi:hypothetical protein